MDHLVLIKRVCSNSWSRDWIPRPERFGRVPSSTNVANGDPVLTTGACSNLLTMPAGVLADARRDVTHSAIKTIAMATASDEMMTAADGVCTPSGCHPLVARRCIAACRSYPFPVRLVRPAVLVLGVALASGAVVMTLCYVGDTLHAGQPLYACHPIQMQRGTLQRNHPDLVNTGSL
jgi:hypothetical protein